ncbi:MAG: Ureidoglycolate lyase [Geoglossum simile]|nr:MAG: Ureidoglycolate lyase [Geoglossum simile]
MTLAVKVPSAPLRLTAEPLTPSAFAPFGTVVESPSRSVHRGPSTVAVATNQGTALRYGDVAQPVNLYDRAPSRLSAKLVMSMFICSPRELLPEVKPIGTTAGDGQSQGEVEGLFPIRILERHPFTTQTFIPLGLSSSDTSYLVIVAPTLPLSRGREARPPPFPLPEPRKRRPLGEILSRARPPPFPENASPAPSPGRGRRKGLPDLKNLRAFIANGSQAITYGVGTWHAPMAVVGKSKVEFVVVQYSNGVTEEDCQEVEITADIVDGMIVAAIPRIGFQTPANGEFKAKL